MAINLLHHNYDIGNTVQMDYTNSTNAWGGPAVSQTITVGGTGTVGTVWLSGNGTAPSPVQVQEPGWVLAALEAMHAAERAALREEILRELMAVPVLEPNAPRQIRLRD